MFLPTEVGEMPPLTLWDGFDFDSVDQGFDETGKYYLLFQDFNQSCFLQVVYFDRDSMSLKSNLIKMKFPDFQDERLFIRRFFFDRHGAQAIHAIERYSKNIEGRDKIKRVDLYYYCFYDLLETKSDHDIMLEEDQKPNFSLKYSDEKRYEEVKFDYQCRDRGVTTL